MWRTRLDPFSIWKDPEVVKRLERYYYLTRDERIARFLLVKAQPVDIELNADLNDLWKEHERVAREFSKFIKDRDQGIHAKVIPPISKPSYLDLKNKIAIEILKECCFCERQCKVNRMEDKYGVCKVGKNAIVSSAFLHTGEEPVLVPSGTIFFSGCTFKCVFCQNHSISQEWKGSQGEILDGIEQNPDQISRIAGALVRKGARNINWVGGDPTSNLHVILHSLNLLELNICQLWNSNMYLSTNGMNLILDLMDFWLPDLKYAEDDFAKEMSKIDNYWEIITRNIKMAHDLGSGEMIIRHLIMPGRVERDTFPILEWCAKETPRALVNVMAQYHPSHLVSSQKYPNINRRITYEELSKARDKADELGILWRPVS